MGKCILLRHKGTAELEFTYTGEYRLGGSPDGEWQLALLTDGSLTFKTLPEDKLDVFLVGAGCNGGRGGYVDDIDYGGPGGNGGNVKTVASVTAEEGVPYRAVIGQPSAVIGGQGGESTISSLSSGGAGSEFRTGGLNMEDGKNGFTAFGDPSAGPWPGRRFGASGAGGGVMNYNTGRTEKGGKGGETGGGNGGDGYIPGVFPGTDGQKNTGAGGGNGGIGTSTGKFGKGGSGIIIIRMHKE